MQVLEGAMKLSNLTRICLAVSVSTCAVGYIFAQTSTQTSTSQTAGGSATASAQGYASGGASGSSSSFASGGSFGGGSSSSGTTAGAPSIGMTYTVTFELNTNSREIQATTALQSEFMRLNASKGIVILEGPYLDGPQRMAIIKVENEAQALAFANAAPLVNNHLAKFSIRPYRVENSSVISITPVPSRKN